MSAEISFSKKISQPFSGNDTTELSKINTEDFVKLLEGNSKIIQKGLSLIIIFYGLYNKIKTK